MKRTVANAHLQRAIELHRNGKLRQAAAAYEKGLGIEPNNADAYHMAGIVAFQTGDLKKAAHYFRRAISLNPNNYEMQVNLGSALWRLGQPEDALPALQRAIALHPTCAEAFVLSGHCHQDAGRAAEAESAFRTALTLRPGWSDALEGLAYALAALGRDEEALHSAAEALAREPKRAGAQRLRGDVLQRRMDFADAAQAYEQALAIDPNDPATHDHFGLLLTKMGHTADAIEHYRTALKRRPADSTQCYNLAVALLAGGGFEEGWKLFSARHGRRNGFLAERSYGAPLFEGGAFAGRHLLVWTDQGVGEEIMFASLVPDLLAKGARLTLECGPRLAPLFQRSFPDVEVIPRETPPHPRIASKFDAHSALADLARWLRPSFDAFPPHAGYLLPDRTVRQRLRHNYAPTGKPIVGISWQTRADANAKLSPQKTLNLEHWAPLFRLKDVAFVNLQYGDCADEIAAAEVRCGVHIIRDPSVDPLKDLDAFAAQVSAMDAVVTISNSTAHMAGALGVPTWTLVPRGYGALWHWFEERDDSPWYRSMHLLRQQKIGAWDGLLETAATQLTSHLLARTG